MTANASVSDAAVFASAAFAHNGAASAAVPQTHKAHARMNPPSFEKYPNKLNMSDARPNVRSNSALTPLNRTPCQKSQLPDSPVASISTSKSSRQTSARKYTTGVGDRSDPDSASSMARRSDGCRT